LKGRALKSSTEWDWGVGTDDFGFNAKPAGYQYWNNSFIRMGNRTLLWTRTWDMSWEGGYGEWLRIYLRDLDANSDQILPRAIPNTE